jgi:hypothetical protein
MHISETVGLLSDVVVDKVKAQGRDFMFELPMRVY